MNAQEIIERVMTAHHDIAGCQCWFCKASRAAGYYARKDLPMHPGNVPEFPQEPLEPESDSG